MSVWFSQFQLRSLSSFFFFFFLIISFSFERRYSRILRADVARWDEDGAAENGRNAANGHQMGNKSWRHFYSCLNQRSIRRRYSIYWTAVELCHRSLHRRGIVSLRLRFSMIGWLQSAVTGCQLASSFRDIAPMLNILPSWLNYRSTTNLNHVRSFYFFFLYFPFLPFSSLFFPFLPFSSLFFIFFFFSSPFQIDFSVGLGNNIYHLFWSVFVRTCYAHRPSRRLLNPI